MKRIMLGWLRVLFTPSCWQQNNTYSKQWDETLNRLMQEHKFKPQRYVLTAKVFTAFLGDTEIWVSNHPYASMGLKGMGTRPKRITILRAYDQYLIDAFAEEYGEKIDCLREKVL